MSASLLKAIVWELCQRFFTSVFSLCNIKGYFYWKCNFYRPCIRNPVSGLFQIGYKSEKWQWHHNFLTWHHLQLFSRCRVSLVKFSYCSKFHIKVITGSRVLKIFFYKGLTGNMKIGNAPVLVLPNSCRLGQVSDTKFGTNVSNKMLLNAAKFQEYSFYRFWVIKRKPTGRGWGRGGVIPPTHPHTHPLTHTHTQIKIKSQRPILKIWL